MDTIEIIELMDSIGNVEKQQIKGNQPPFNNL
jgi:hypothetical protein